MKFESSFTIKGDTRCLKPLREWLGVAAGMLGEERFPKKALMPCSLALTEAIDNAIFHAHEGNEELPISVSISISDSRICFVITDSGTGIGDPDLPEPDEMVNHGRGLFIIRELMSEVESDVVNGKHHLRMVYKL